MRHVNSSTTAICHATYNNLFIPSDNVGDNDIDMENTGGNFEGDFFGPDYEQADFGWLEGDETIGIEVHYLESCKYLQFIVRADKSKEHLRRRGMMMKQMILEWT